MIKLHLVSATTTSSSGLAALCNSTTAVGVEGGTRIEMTIYAKKRIAACYLLLFSRPLTIRSTYLPRDLGNDALRVIPQHVLPTFINQKKCSAEP